MRVLQVINSLNIGGAEQLVVNLLPKLWEQGCEVDLCVFNGVETALTRQVNELQSSTCKGMKFIHLTSEGPEYSIKYIPALRRIIKDYDIAHAHNTSAQITLAAASIGNKGIKLVTTEHSTNNRRRHMPLLKPIDRWMYSQYDSIIAISQPAADDIIEYIPKLNKKTIVISNGVDIDKFSNAKPYTEGELKDAKGEIVELNGKKIIIQVAGLKYPKDQETLINSLQYLPDDYNVWIVGDGYLHDEIHQYAAKESEKLNGGKNRIVFFGNRKDIPRLLRTADIVCMSTLYEGLSLSNLEGMAAGKPFVASDVEGIREVTDGYGILCPAKDAKAFADAFMHLSTDKAFAKGVVARCYERACQYSIDNTAAGYAKLYKSLL